MLMMRRVDGVLGEIRFNTGYPDTQDTQDTQGDTQSSLRDHNQGSANQTFETFLRELEEGVPSSLTLRQFIHCAAQHYRSTWEPNQEKWCSALWHYVRLLKVHPHLADLDADDAFDLTWEVADDLGGLEDLLGVGMDEESIELEFLTCWDKIRFRPGLTPLENAAAQADSMPLVPRRCRNGRNGLYARFVSIAGWLQVSMRDRNILLPIDLLAGILKCDRSRVSQLRQLACKDGFLEVIKKHLYKSGGTGRATEFRFDVSQFECLEEGLG
jgi:hypothetical protein